MIGQRKLVSVLTILIGIILASHTCTFARGEINVDSLMEGVLKGTYRFSTAVSGSMEPTINEGYSLVLDTYIYTRIDPERGDIVAAVNPVKAYGGENVAYICRIIGLPGETVEIEGGKIYINGDEEPLDESYLKEEWVLQNTGYYFEIPENSYLVLGDNRNNSNDSRYWADMAMAMYPEIPQAEAESLSYVSEDGLLGKYVCKIFFEELK